jgi:predicted transposase YbfD/YdcC
MYSTPVGEALAQLPPLSDAQRSSLLSDRGLTSLVAVFERVPDPRAHLGRRYALPFLLTCLVAALLCNCNSTHAVEQWCREHQPLLARVFGPLRHLSPSGSLYRRLLPRLSAQHLEWALAAWVRATRPDDDTEPVAVDGKTVRGAATVEQAAPHLLAFCTHQSQETLLQAPVGEKTNEIPVAQALVPFLAWNGRVCTADALHTQIAFVRAVRAAGGHVVLTVKDNQPTLVADLATLFADPLTTVAEAETLDWCRGRREWRRLRVSTELNAYLATDSAWPEIAQVAQLTRSVVALGPRGVPVARRSETVYLITTLSPEQASPHRLLELVRGHWHIENRLHYVRDVTFGEDRSRLRTGNAPQILAALRNLVITLIHRCGSCDIAAARRAFAYHPHRALALLVPSLVA